MSKIIFRVLLFAAGIFIMFLAARDLGKAFFFRAAGQTVEGKVIGFRGGSHNSKTVLQESSGRKKGKRQARRPVVQYPVASGATDSMLLYSSTKTIFTFTNYELGETVPIVFLENHPADAQIWAFQLIFSNFLIFLVGIFMIWLGMGGKL